MGCCSTNVGKGRGPSSCSGALGRAVGLADEAAAVVVVAWAMEVEGDATEVVEGTVGVGAERTADTAVGLGVEGVTEAEAATEDEGVVGAEYVVFSLMILYASAGVISLICCALYPNPLSWCFICLVIMKGTSSCCSTVC